MAYSRSRTGAKTSVETITAFRMCAPRWASSALTGEGARKYGGRWNSPGHPVVYLGDSRALTALELLVHLTTPGSRLKAYTLLEVSFPARCLERGLVVGTDWNVSPPTKCSTHVGDEWMTRSSSLALRVPSTLVREESVILLNPLHPDFAKVKTVSERPFYFDQRFHIT